MSKSDRSDRHFHSATQSYVLIMVLLALIAIVNAVQTYSVFYENVRD